MCGVFKAAAAVITSKAPTVPALDLLKRTDKEFDMGSSPLGSPLTPDSVDNSSGAERAGAITIQNLIKLNMNLKRFNDCILFIL